MTRLLCLLGSPRDKANSSALARHFADTAKAEGAEVEVVPLASLAFSGCQNLMRCKTGASRCGQEDAFTPVLQGIHEADILLLASPIYFTDVSGLLKQAIDRFFSFFRDDYVTNPEKSRLPPGKSLVMALVQGEPETRCADVFERYGRPFGMLGFEDRHLLRACGLREANAISGRPELLDEAAQLAHRLVTARLGTMLEGR